MGNDRVREVAYNEHFILAKKYQYLKDTLGLFTDSYDENLAEYYIIPIDSANARNKYFGPLTAKEFEVKRKKAGVPDSLQLEKIYK